MKKHNLYTLNTLQRALYCQRYLLVRGFISSYERQRIIARIRREYEKILTERWLKNAKKNSDRPYVDPPDFPELR